MEKNLWLKWTFKQNPRRLTFFHIHSCFVCFYLIINLAYQKEQFMFHTSDIYDHFMFVCGKIQKKNISNHKLHTIPSKFFLSTHVCLDSSCWNTTAVKHHVLEVVLNSQILPVTYLFFVYFGSFGYGLGSPSRVVESVLDSSLWRCTTPSSPGGDLEWTQNMLEGLYIPSGLGSFQNLPEGLTVGLAWLRPARLWFGCGPQF